MPYCPSCSAHVPEGASHCPTCGPSLLTTPRAADEPAPPAPHLDPNALPAEPADAPSPPYEHLRPLGRRTGREPKAMRWMRKKLGADLGRPPRVPWLLAAVFVALPFAVLLNLAPAIAAILLALLAAAPVAFARLDR